jgi:hypothetical protein
MSKQNSLTRVNHVIAFLLVVLAFTTGAEARRIHHTNPLEQLVQTYYGDYSS